MTVGLVVATFASLIPLDALGEMTQHRNAAGVHHRVRRVSGCCGGGVRRLPRPFRAPWVPVTPILGIVVSLAMMVGLPLGDVDAADRLAGCSAC